MSETAPKKKEVPFIKAVVARSERPTKLVNQVLSKYRIEAVGAAPTARPLRVAKVSFAGKKTIHGETSEFSFDWHINGNGVWGIMADENLAGKSSILQVILWALRGRPKSLTETVEQWIEKVDVGFVVDGRPMQVKFDVVDEQPVGLISFGEPSKSPIVKNFADTDEFQDSMQEIMLSALGLEPIPTSQQAGGRIVAYNDGWAAYTGAFLTDADSDAIIGEQTGGDLIQRLLQVYIGIPWVKTFFQARTQARLLEADTASRRRKLAGLGGKSLEDLESDLAEVEEKIADEGARSLASQRLNDARLERDALTKRISEMNRSYGQAKDTVELSYQSKVKAEQLVNAIKEENAASQFFGSLKPHSCPRCSSSIDESQIKKEQTDHACSVCSKPVEQPDPDEVAAQLQQAEERLTLARKTEKDATKFVNKLGRNMALARDELEVVGQTMNELAAAGTAADAGLLQTEKDRLQGMIEAARAIFESVDDNTDELAIVKAASDEANQRVQTAAISVMKEISGEVTRISQTLGMKDVESVTLKRNAHVEIVKGASLSKWKDLSPGERLRLRIATVIALSRGSQKMGMGRHPGLLLIDSPGREEMQPDDLKQTINELIGLTAEYPDTQMFIAMTGKPSDLSGVASDRIVHAAKGKKLW